MEMFTEKVLNILKPVIDKYGEDVVEFGPSHIFYSDYNYEDDHLDFCIGHCSQDYFHYKEYSGESLEALRTALIRIKNEVPENERMTEDYYKVYERCEEE